MEKIAKMEIIQTIDNADIGEMCRACFEKCGEYKMLFENAANIANRSLGDVFFDVVKIEMTPDAQSSSPNRICLPCSKELISAYNFIQKSQQSHNRFLDYLKSQNIKPSDCLSEFPIDIPSEPASSDFLQIKVEDEIMTDYTYPQDDEMFASSCSDSESDDEPLLNKKDKLNKMQCTYCGRVFKRLDFLQNHQKKHEEEIKKNEGESTEIDLKFTCDDCGLSCTSKLELKTHRIANHPARTTTTRTQQTMLIEWIEKYPFMAKSTVEKSHARQKRMKGWKILTRLLNENGPPEKNVCAWKKTWADYKHRAKSKLTKIRTSLKKARAEPCKQLQLTSFERRVMNLMGIKSSATGMKNVNKFDSECQVEAARAPSNESPIPSTSQQRPTDTDREDEVKDLLLGLLNKNKSTDGYGFEQTKKEMPKPNDSNFSPGKCSLLKTDLNVTEKYLEKLINILIEIRNLKREELEYRKKVDKDFLDIENRKLSLREKELSVALTTNELKRIQLNLKDQTQ